MPCGRADELRAGWGARCFWFSEGFREGNKVEFPDLLKKKTYRRMVGKSKLLARDGEE
jgi:hypothetical protein